MKTFRSQGGSTLVVVLGFVIILVLFCSSILQISQQEYRLSKRSAGWNQALFSAEAGVELGWNELNKLVGINTNGNFMSGWSYATNTWIASSQTLSPITGSEGNSTFSVSVNTNSGLPVITSSGTMSSALYNQTVTRNVQVSLAQTTPFSYAMLAKGLIDFNGNTAVVDSFNSTNGNYAVGIRRAHGNVGTNGSLIDAAGLDIWGSMKTGPGGVVTADPGFNQYQPTAPDTGTNTVSDGLKVSIPDSTLPFAPTANLIPPDVAGTPTLTAGTHVDVTVDTIDSDLVITGNGTIRIYVNGAINLGGSDDITITPSPAGSTLKVEFYVKNSVDLLGNGIINPSQKPTDLFIYGLPTCTSVQVSGTADFKGAIYTPNATTTLNGGARIDGSLVANTINAVGTIDFHYDEALATLGNPTGYTIAAWKEY
jgi:Tfp pilus assembly protein PilX